MKTMCYALVALLTTFIAVSCGDDDTEIIDSTVIPTNVSLNFDIAQDNSGLVTITPSAESANSFTIFFGDGSGESATVSAGNSVDRTYPEGSFDVRVVATSISGDTAEATQQLMVSFNPPENLVVTIGEVDGDPFSRTVSATADFATMFNVFFGDEENEEPTVLMIGETITQTYATPGEFVIRVVAIGGGTATIEESTTVTISSATAILLDFEGDTSTLGFEGFEGADSAIEDNPDPSGINTSSTVLRSTKTDGAQFFAGTLINLDEALDFSLGEAIVINTYSPKADIPIRVAIENQTTGNQIFVDVNTTGINEWEELVFDFSGLIDPSISYDRIVIFFEFIVDLPGDGSIYYVDNIGLTAGSGDTGGGDTGGEVALPLNFESMDLQFDIEGFEGADSAVEDNAFPMGINTSTRVVRSTKTMGAQFFAGTIVDLDVPIDFSQGEAIAINTYSPKLDIPIRVAIENQTVGADSQIFADVNTTVANDWENLVFDFGGRLDPNISYDRVVVFFEFIVDLPGDGTTYFFDNIEVTEGSGDTGGGDMGTGMLINGDFEAGSAPWTAGVGSDPAPVVTENGNTFYSVNVDTAGDVFSVNLSQTGLSITPDTNYILTFDAWSDVDRSIVAGIGLSGGDFSNTSVPVNITTSMQTFTLQLTAVGFGDNNSRVLFDSGGEVGMVNIDNVSLAEGGDGSDTPDMDGGDMGSIMLINGDFEAGSAPWTVGVGSDPAPVVTENGNTFYSVNVDTAGDVFSVNVSQTGLTIVNGTNYILTFDAWSDVDRSIVAGIGLSGGDFSNTSVPVNLTTSVQTFTLQLTAAGFGDDNSRVLFDNGGEVGLVNIDNVTIVEGGDGSDTP